MWEGGEDRKAIAHEEREPNPFLALYDVKTGSGCRSSVKGGQFWAVNVFSYTTHAQTDSWPSRSPPCPFHLFPLLLWRFPSSQLFCVHYTDQPTSWIIYGSDNGIQQLGFWLLGFVHHPTFKDTTFWKLDLLLSSGLKQGHLLCWVTGNVFLNIGDGQRPKPQ
jgi:hypothetical protein